ncbi:MAG: DUF4416 family protein [Nitrospirae bacterium]|nr:DUF4416 family protein [Nitrospirota bacterium]MCL5237895.1 DUF4416 family protein [Nitrospirota bacterium]
MRRRIPRAPAKALLFVGTLFSNEEHLAKARRSLEEHFGEIIMESPALEWDFSDYYREEMGGPIYRRFLFFRELTEQDKIASIKLITNEIEKELSTGDKRNINLDPGYLTLAKLVLATTKDYSHRLYLKDGIYAEVTLMYQKQKGRFIPNINTYRDYADSRYQRIFHIARGLLCLLSKSAGV